MLLLAGFPVKAACDALPPGGGATLQVSREDGRASVEVDRPGAAGQKVRVEYDDETYVQEISEAGNARVSFALLAAANRFTVYLLGLAPVFCTLDEPDFDKFFRVVLIWQDPVLLDLHVVEPGRVLASFGSINRSRPNLDLRQGGGRMDVVTGAPADGATAQLSYVVARPSANTQTKLYSFRMEYLTRGSLPRPPYCEEHPLADIQAQLIILDRGKVTRRSYGTGLAQCGEPLTDAQRLMPLRH